jgi:hypothetical protein
MSPAQFLKGDTQIKSGYDGKRVMKERGIRTQFQVRIADKLSDGTVKP